MVKKNLLGEMEEDGFGCIFVPQTNKKTNPEWIGLFVVGEDGFVCIFIPSE